MPGGPVEDHHPLAQGRRGSQTRPDRAGRRGSAEVRHGLPGYLERPDSIRRRVRIYTRKGDDGTTGLLYGGRVRKDSPRIEVNGAVDEAQAALGMARAEAEAGIGARQPPGRPRARPLRADGRGGHAPTSTGAALVPGPRWSPPRWWRPSRRHIDDLTGRFEMPTSSWCPVRTAVRPPSTWPGPWCAGPSGWWSAALVDRALSQVGPTSTGSRTCCGRWPVGRRATRTWRPDVGVAGAASRRDVMALDGRGPRSGRGRSATWWRSGLLAPGRAPTDPSWRRRTRRRRRRPRRSTELPGGVAPAGFHGQGRPVAGPAAGRPGTGLVVVGLGDARGPRPERWRRAAAALVRAAAGGGPRRWRSRPPPRRRPGDDGRAVAEGAALAAYRFDDLQELDPQPGALDGLLVVDPTGRSRRGGRRRGPAGRAAAAAVTFARDLVNTPAGDLTPSRLGRAAVGDAVGDAARPRSRCGTRTVSWPSGWGASWGSAGARSSRPVWSAPSTSPPTR